jgi:glycosyltransferase involved in cell wall biosynthesis
MKILYCIKSMEHAAGMESILYSKAGYLHKEFHHQVYIATTDQNGAPAAFDLPDRAGQIDLKINYSAALVYPAGSIRRYLQYLPKFLLHAVRLKALLNTMKPDLIVSMGDQDEWILPLIHGKIPILSECHFHYRARYDQNPNRFEKVHMSLERWIRSRYACLVLLTRADQKAWNLRRSVAIPNFSRFQNKGRLADVSHSHRIIAVGRLEEQKGFDYLIQIWAKVLEKHPELGTWSVDIFGEGSLKEKIVSDIRSHGLEDSMHLCGRAENIADEYAKSAIFVLPSRFEGFPLVLIEAMSCGLAPVAFACPQGPEEIIRNRAEGILIPCYQIETFADALAELMLDEERRVSVAQKAFLRSQDFAPEKIMQRWHALFTAIAGKDCS